jgi:hypothetical protein
MDITAVLVLQADVLLPVIKRALLRWSITDRGGRLLGWSGRGMTRQHRLGTGSRVR